MIKDKHIDKQNLINFLNDFHFIIQDDGLWIKKIKGYHKKHFIDLLFKRKNLKKEFLIKMFLTMIEENNRFTMVSTNNNNLYNISQELKKDLWNRIYSGKMKTLNDYLWAYDIFLALNFKDDALALHKMMITML